MTRLTQEQIAEAWDSANGKNSFVPFSHWRDGFRDSIVAFAHRIAALAVQEVERERVLAVNAHNHAHRRCAELELAHDRLRAEVATLTAQLAERENVLTAVMENRAEVEAQLAEVTKERDRASAMSDQYRAKWADADSRNTALRAQLATAKREKGEIAWQAFHSGAGWAAENRGATWDDIAKEVYRRYPATPSGAAQWDISEPRNPATPSPEAREVPELVTLDVELNMGDGCWVDLCNHHVRITPAAAKRIMQLAQQGAN
jgi:hypothetical protein